VCIPLCPFSGCGGGGGGGAPAAVPGPVTKANVKAYLFGNITGASNIVATTQATMNIPNGIFVNYSSGPGDIYGKLRNVVIYPSGSVLVNCADFSSSTYEIATRKLTINMFNSGRVPIKSSFVGKGAEFATVVLSLTAAGVTPTGMPLADPLASVGQENTSTHATDFPAGNYVNFDTTYQ